MAILSVSEIPSIPKHLTHAMVGLIERIFALTPEWQYRRDDPESKIKILTQFAKDDPTILLKPAVVVSRGEIYWQRVSMNRLKQLKLGGTFEGVELIMSNFGLQCISHSQAESEDIASHLFSLFMTFRILLSKKGYHFLRLESVSMGQANSMQVSPGTDLFNTPVVIQLVTALQWKLTPIGPLLELITLNITEQGEPEPVTVKLIAEQ